MRGIYSSSFFLLKKIKEMRPKERIPLFFKLVDWEYLSNRWKLPKRIDIHVLNHVPYINVNKYWLDNPDQRIGQVLINLNLLPDKMNIWSDEEIDILLDQGVEPREFTFWTSHLDEFGNKLKKPITRLIKDLDTIHIEHILYNEYLFLNDKYKQVFEKELDLRKEAN